jgi:hypothetical protein
LGGEVAFEFVPECVYWKRWTDRYGFPNSGGWLSQPQLFMKDIEAVRRGIDKRGIERATTEQLLKQILNALSRGKNDGLRESF